MSDAAIVGIVGIIAATVIAPLIAYQIRKDEDGRRDVIDALDGAVTPYRSRAAPRTGTARR
jgi:hypothetical protein